MKGSYVLLIELENACRLKIGALGKIRFKKGSYAYVGSGMNNLEKRTARHLRKKKRLHWHIDYFLQKARIKEVYYKEKSRKEECKIARKFSQTFSSVKNFGCSDCECGSHLFYSENVGNLKKVALNLSLLKAV